MLLQTLGSVRNDDDVQTALASFIELASYKGQNELWFRLLADYAQGNLFARYMDDMCAAMVSISRAHDVDLESKRLAVELLHSIMVGASGLRQNVRLRYCSIDGRHFFNLHAAEVTSFERICLRPITYI